MKNIILIFVFASTFVMADGIIKHNTTNELNSSDNFLLPEGFFNVNYNLGWGVGSMKDFISENSYRGFNLDGRKFVNDNFTFGGYMGWTGFYEKFDRSTVIHEWGSVTAVRSNTYYNFTLGVNSHYYPSLNSILKPYVGLNMGPVYQTIQTSMARYYIEDRKWQFMLAPEVGLYVPFGADSDVGLNTGIRYNLVAYTNTTYGFENSLSYFQWFIGISFEY